MGDSGGRAVVDSNRGLGEGGSIGGWVGVGVVAKSWGSVSMSQSWGSISVVGNWGSISVVGNGGSIGVVGHWGSVSVGKGWGSISVVGISWSSVWVVEGSVVGHFGEKAKLDDKLLNTQKIRIYLPRTSDLVTEEKGDCTD